jgi:hypothetical protein
MKYKNGQPWFESDFSHKSCFIPNLILNYGISLPSIFALEYIAEYLLIKA